MINLSVEGHLENGGRGMGGVSGFPILPSIWMERGLEEFKFVQYTESGQEILSQFCPTNQSENGSRLQA